MSKKRNPVRIANSFLRNRSGFFRRKWSGFTLVELIVVVSILAILATIGILAFSGYAQDARNSSVTANVKSVHTAISAESAVTNNSPRYYVIHHSWAALSGALVYVDGSPIALSGGFWNQLGTNYSSGNPDYAKLKMNAEKFKVAAKFPASVAPFAFAAYGSGLYDKDYLTVGAMDATSVSPNWRTRNLPYFQVVAILPSTGTAFVTGNYSAMPNSANGLVKDPKGGPADALVDGGTSGIPRYAGCDTDDIVLSNGQAWSACNVGALNAWTWTGVSIPICSGNLSDCAAGMRNLLGSFFQWGRNDDVTASGTWATLAATGTLAATVGNSTFIVNALSPSDWMTAPNDNLWGGQTTNLTTGTYISRGAPGEMKGPCAPGYHVPTGKEWCDAMLAVSPTASGGTAMTCATTWQTEATPNKFLTTMKLPLSWFRDKLNATYYRWSDGHYWTSSVDTAFGGYVRLNPTLWIVIGNSSHRANGFSVRCLRN